MQEAETEKKLSMFQSKQMSDKLSNFDNSVSSDRESPSDVKVFKGDLSDHKITPI